MANTEKQKKPWYKLWWAIILYVFVFFMIIGIFSDSDDSQTESPQAETLEMTTEELFDEFNGLSELQIEEKIKEFKGKRIKTSIYVDKIDEASLSSQYVAMEMYEYPYNLMPAVKAFFPKEEKEELLKANIGDTLVFSGEFVTYNKGGLTSYIEFTKSKLIEVKSAE